MYKLNFKDDIEATCPSCGYTKSYIAYLNTEAIICSNCDKDFEVELYVKDVIWKATGVILDD